MLCSYISSKWVFLVVNIGKYMALGLSCNGRWSRKGDSRLNRCVFNGKTQGTVLKWSYKRGGRLFQVVT